MNEHKSPIASTAASVLVIGAMKSGTTTFYHDLQSHPQIAWAEKESHILSTGFYDDSTAIEAYARLFAKSGPGQIRVDVSTDYAMLPDVTGVPERAHRIIGRDVKVVYLVREPISRCISHHYHMHAWHGVGRMGSDINLCVHQHPQIVNYSRYATQLAAWLEFFPRESISVIKFEDFVQDRATVLLGTHRFLGVDESPAADPNKVHNRSEGKPVLNDFWLRLKNASLYRSWVRPLLGVGIRDAVRQRILPKAPPRPAMPTAETIDFLVESLADEVSRLQQLLGHTQPFWDLETVRRNHLQRTRSAAA